MCIRDRQGVKQLLLPELDWKNLTSYLKTIVQPYPLAVLKVIVMAAHSGRGYARDVSKSPDVLVQILSYPSHYEAWQQGISIDFSPIRLGINPLLAGIKHLNRLEQVLVRDHLSELQKAHPDIQDVLVSDVNNHVIETSCANVFYAIGQQWFTPKLDYSGVNGIYRKRILSAMPKIKETTIQASQLLTEADAMFICNSLMGIVPVKRLAAKSLNITLVKQLKERLCL